MKNILEVIKHKELELQRLQGEVEALRVALRLLSEEDDKLETATPPNGSEARLKEVKTGTANTRSFP